MRINSNPFPSQTDSRLTSLTSLRHEKRESKGIQYCCDGSRSWAFFWTESSALRNVCHHRMMSATRGAGTSERYFPRRGVQIVSIYRPRYDEDPIVTIKQDFFVLAAYFLDVTFCNANWDLCGPQKVNWIIPGNANEIFVLSRHWRCNTKSVTIYIRYKTRCFIFTGEYLCTFNDR